jgi:hypothetical protein
MCMCFVSCIFILAKAVVLLACTQIHKYAKDGFSSMQRFLTFATVFCAFVLSENRFCWW